MTAVPTRPSQHRGSGSPIRRAPRRSRLSPLVTALVALILAGFVALGVSAGVVVAVTRRDLPDVTRVYNPPSRATRIYAANGELVASLFRENRATVPLQQIPLHVRQAVLAIEDARFYQHRGVDFIGIARAMWHNLQSGELVEGGSTITQQLARLLFLSRERAVSRKLTEIALALEIERRLTKDEILERYLNEYYFGQGAYGIEMAARVYFGKPAAELTLAEGAMLAGIIRAPSVYTPYRNMALAKARQRLVLERMVALGMITPAQAAAARSQTVMLKPPSAGLVGIRAPYFVSFILPQLLERFGEDLVYRGGLEVYTTLDVRLQALAEKAVRRGIELGQERNLRLSQGALVAIDPRTGHIKAMIGGYDFAQSQFNRAWQARRQPGSAFKPFIYVTALANGFTADRVLEDTPVVFEIRGSKPWKPKNYDGKFRGPIRLRQAVEQSVNVPAAKTIAELGADRVVEYAKRMGITSPLQPHLSLALGTADVTPLEMASAYGVLANLGVRVRPVAIRKVVDADGRVLYESYPEREVALPPAVAYLMTDILKGVITRGTGRAAALGRPAAGKTGTTDDYRNAWFIGYTPHLVTAVWVGNDDNTPMRRVVGGGLPAEIWASFMRPALQGVPPDDWPRPEEIVQRGGELYIRGTEPPPEPEPLPALPPEGASPVPPGPTLVIDSPADGAQVRTPFAVTGRAWPGATIRVVVMADSGLVSVRIVESFIPADDQGRFLFDFRPATPVPGTRYAITVAATSPQGASTSRTITVVEAGP